MPIQSQLKLDDTKLKDLMQQLKRDYYKVKVGVLNGGGEVDPDTNVTVATYGYYNEFGFMINKNTEVPARSFIRSPLNLHLSEQILKYKEKLSNLLFKERKIKKAYDLLGLGAKYIILKAFSTKNDGQWAKNATSTVKAKGFDNALIWHGRLRKSIDYQLVTTGGKQLSTGDKK